MEQIEVGTAKHLALERFQAIHMALHRAVTPGSRHAGFDRVIIVAQPLCKPLQGYQGTLRPPGQPGIQLLCLPLAHELGKILGERDGVGELGILRHELREQVISSGVRCSGRRRTSQVARRGVKERCCGLVTTGKGWRSRRCRGAPPCASRRRWA